MSENMRIEESDGCGGEKLTVGACPLKEPLALVQQRLTLQLEEFHKDLRKVVYAVEGNGKPGLKERLLLAETEIREVKTDIHTIMKDMTLMKDKSEDWKGRVMMALVYLAAGGGGVAGLMNIFGG